MQDAKQTNQPEKLYEGAGCGFQINWKFQEDYPSFFFLDLDLKSLLWTLLSWAGLLILKYLSMGSQIFAFPGSYSDI